jgi:carbonic anhydrase
MDTRLTELLPKAMNLRNGDAKIIKDAGALVSHPFGSIMRSILVAIYQLNAEEVYVVGHHDCGMTGLNPEEVLQKAAERGVPDATLNTLSHSGIDLNRFLTGFGNVRESVTGSVKVIRNHPLLPKDIKVFGLVIDPETGRLELVADANDANETI